MTSILPGYILTSHLGSWGLPGWDLGSGGLLGWDLGSGGFLGWDLGSGGLLGWDPLFLTSAVENHIQYWYITKIIQQHCNFSGI